MTCNEQDPNSAVVGVEDKGGDIFRILMLGGYGNAGRPLSKQLLQYTPPHVHLVIAGRHLDKAEQWVKELSQDPSTVHTIQRISACQVDASDGTALCEAFLETRTNLVLVASSTSDLVETVAAAALRANIDYYDIQFSRKKFEKLHSMSNEIQQAGRCFITEGGFHPGLIALLIRYMVATNHFDSLQSALVGSVIRGDWNHLEQELSGETMEEFASEFINMEMLEYKNHVWEESDWKSFLLNAKTMDFGEPFGKQYCIPIFFEEMRNLPDMIPGGVTEMAFYMAGLNWFVDWIISPIVIIALLLFPVRAKRLMGRLLLWGLRTFSSPPYGTRLKVECRGIVNGDNTEKSLILSHQDAYILTAIPVVATLLQYLASFSGSDTKRWEGLCLQAHIVEPVQFMQDLERMGIQIIACQEDKS